MQCWIELCSGCSGIVVYGGGDIVFGAKRSNQWMQWTQYAVDAVHSGHNMQWTQYTVDAVHSGHNMQWTQYTVDAVHSGHSNSRKCSFDTNVLSSRYLSESIK